MPSKTKKTRKEQRTFGTTWMCCDVRMDHPTMLTHLRNVHKLDPKTTKVHQEMTMHLDGDDWYSSSYDCTIALPDGKDLKLHRYTCNKREGSDAMYWKA